MVVVKLNFFLKTEAIVCLYISSLIWEKMILDICVLKQKMMAKKKTHSWTLRLHLICLPCSLLVYWKRIKCPHWFIALHCIRQFTSHYVATRLLVLAAADGMVFGITRTWIIIKESYKLETKTPFIMSRASIKHFMLIYYSTCCENQDCSYL